MRDLSDETQLKKATQWAKLDEKARLEALKSLLSTAIGRAYVYDLLQACGVFRNSFNTQALQMAYNCGQTSIGLWVMADIESVDPAAYQRMINERNQRNADRTDVINSISDASDTGGRPASEDNPNYDPFAHLSDPVKYDN